MICPDEIETIKTVQAAGLSIHAELQTSLTIAVVRWLQREKLDVMALTEHDIIARTKASWGKGALRC